MSAYAKDPRVKAISEYRFDVFEVDCEGAAPPVGMANWHPNDGWAALLYGSKELPTFDTADEAIRSLIGEPQ